MSRTKLRYRAAVVTATSLPSRSWRKGPAPPTRSQRSGGEFVGDTWTTGVSLVTSGTGTSAPSLESTQRQYGSASTMPVPPSGRVPVATAAVMRSIGATGSGTAVVASQALVAPSAPCRRTRRLDSPTPTVARQVVALGSTANSGTVQTSAN